MRSLRVAAALGLAASAAAGFPVSAQSLAARVDAVQNGTVLLTFRARPDVCGDGNGGGMWTRGDRYVRGSWVCVNGPVRVSIGRSDKQTVSVRTHVGGRWGESSSLETNLGEVPAPEAARFLIDLARTLGGRSASDALSAAVFADGVDISSELTRLVRDDAVSIETRKTALFWLGQSDDEPIAELVRLYETLKPYSLREQYVFVLSQRRDDAAVDKLIDVAKRDPDLEIRKRAMFWLAQSHEPKAVKFFQDVLKP
jgi:hypothetical protein